MPTNSKLTWKLKYAPGTLSAKGFNAAGHVIATAKVETTGPAASLRLVPDRTTLQANGEDVSVFTVSALDAQGRLVPVAQNPVAFTLEGAGRILGVGNGDPSCHEPDEFVPEIPVRTLAVNNWRWQLTKRPKKGAMLPEYGDQADDSTWNSIKPKTDGDTGDMVLKEGQFAVYRAHVNLTAADLASENIQVRFAGIDDHGWVFVNRQLVGESANWEDQPAFDIKKTLHPGDNLIAVGVFNESGTGGLNPDVNLELMGKPLASAWTRSLFNGLAQVMVQSTHNAGPIKLTASASGVQSATATVHSVPGGMRPSVP
jgi:beta-galactosidase